MPSKTVSSRAPSKKAAAAACACGPVTIAPSTKAGRKAVAVDQVLKASNIVRLKRAEGQVRGVLRMVEEDRYCADTIIQIAAAQESLRAVAKNLLKNHLKHCARAALKAGQAEADAMCNELMDVMSKIAR
jgi:DNA-binding FrmR family transcriptional regulator